MVFQIASGEKNEEGVLKKEKKKMIVPWKQLSAIFKSKLANKVSSADTAVVAAVTVTRDVVDSCP